MEIPSVKTHLIYMMFDIDELKQMKLLELQEIAQKIEVPKFRQLKKLDLVYQILDVQASNPKQVKEIAGSVQKSKRKRISKSEQDGEQAAPFQEAALTSPEKQETKSVPQEASAPKEEQQEQGPKTQDKPDQKPRSPKQKKKPGST